MAHKRKGKPLHVRHKERLRFRLASFVLFVAGVLALFGGFAQADLFLASTAAIVALVGGLALCAYLHHGARMAALSGVLMIEVPLLVSYEEYWILLCALGVAAIYYIVKHE